MRSTGIDIGDPATDRGERFRVVVANAKHGIVYVLSHDHIWAVSARYLRWAAGKLQRLFGFRRDNFHG